MEEERFMGIIYKISSPHTEKVYIGSTICTLKKRLQGHKANYKMYMNGKYHFVTSFEVIKLGDTVIEELEKLENITLVELHHREGYLIKNTNNAINQVIPGRTKHEYYEDTIETQKIKFKTYRENNKDQIKQYRDNNKDILNEYKREKYKEDRTVILEMKKEKRKVKIVCVCGGSFRHDDLSRHNKSKKHLSYIQNLTPPVINITIQNLTINNK